MLGKTVDSGKKAAPNYSLSGRNKQGGFHEDLAKVIAMIYLWRSKSYSMCVMTDQTIKTKL